MNSFIKFSMALLCMLTVACGETKDEPELPPRTRNPGTARDPCG